MCLIILFIKTLPHRPYVITLYRCTLGQNKRIKDILQVTEYNSLLSFIHSEQFQVDLRQARLHYTV